MAASTSHSFEGLCNYRKRSNPNGSDDERPNIKTARSSFTNYYVLQSESDGPSDEDTESIYSVQDKPTDSAKDTSDLSFSSEDSNIVYTIGGNDRNDICGSSQIIEEYEPASISEKEDDVPDVFSSTSDGENIQPFDREVIVIAHDEDIWADSSSISSEDETTIDPELSLRDYWSCVQCKATNNNPMFRYCEKCFKIRKNFFPPRPKSKKKKKKKLRTRLNRKKEKKDCVSNSQNVSDLLSNQEGEFSGQSHSLNLASNDKTNQNILNCVSTASPVTSSVSSDCTVTSVSLESGVIITPSTSGIDTTSSRDVYDNSVRQLNSSHKSVSRTSSKDSNLCETCLTKPKDGVFLHGRKLGHMFCCYQCSLKVWKDTGRCPLCNGKINQVIKVIS